MLIAETDELTQPPLSSVLLKYMYHILVGELNLQIELLNTSKFDNEMWFKLELY